MTTFQIKLEDMAGTSWWAGVLTALTSQSGSTYLRFVGRVDGHRHYKGATFPAPRRSARCLRRRRGRPG
jgi:hypothetical protein